MQNTDAIKSDLLHVFKYFPTECLMHLKNNRQRLIRRSYQQGENGCMFFLLSEPLPANKRISSRETLTRYFTGGEGEAFQAHPNVLPAQALVRAVDGKVTEIPNKRYGDLEQLEWDLVFETLDEEVHARACGERMYLDAELLVRIAC